jgi:hypothetical protein
MPTVTRSLAGGFRAAPSAVDVIIYGAARLLAPAARKRRRFIAAVLAGIACSPVLALAKKAGLSQKRPQAAASRGTIATPGIIRETGGMATRFLGEEHDPDSWG